MAFYVSPCDNGGELRRLITAGGGKVAEKSSKDVINLIPEGLQHKKLRKLEDAISSRFVVDCMSRKTLLQLSDYRLAKPPGAGTAANVAPAAPKAAAKAAAAAAPGAAPARRGHQKRDRFTAEDDAAMVDWVKKNPYLRTQGKEIWQRAVTAKVTGHSWQSMQNRYRRYLKEKREEEKREELRKSLANGAAAAGAPAAARMGPGPAALVAAADEDFIEDFSQPTASPKRKAPEAETQRKRPQWRKSLSCWQVRKEKKRDRLGAPETPEVATPRESRGVVAESQPVSANAEASSARPVKRLNLDPFEGVPEWILETQDLERAADISLLV